MDDSATLMQGLRHYRNKGRLDIQAEKLTMFHGACLKAAHGAN